MEFTRGFNWLFSSETTFSSSAQVWSKLLILYFDCVYKNLGYILLIIVRFLSMAMLGFIFSLVLLLGCFNLHCNEFFLNCGYGWSIIFIVATFLLNHISGHIIHLLPTFFFLSLNFFFFLLIFLTYCSTFSNISPFLLPFHSSSIPLEHQHQ